ncbi:Interleukin-9 receptor [Larimichthys crocea]|uniref:Interleukin-9 receptor n=1 Tax=Larimichthys crocea TaxID=215358 RepID=A0A6G0HZ42_LARCR|nr:Interleukin-9 receptor [Larimichthys crocea]
MDWCSTPRLNLRLLTMFLLVSTTICLHGNPITGVHHNLHCVNDYLFTINCSLVIAPSENSSDSSSSYWLTIMETYEQEKFKCMLTNVKGDYFCSVKIANPPDDDYPDLLDDLDEFEIKLCHNKKDGSENCELLNNAYRPQDNIKPNTPCCLTVNHNSSQWRFAWKSTYEQYSSFSTMGDSLNYQLQFFKRGDKDKVTSQDIHRFNRHFSVDDENFAPGTKYAARVRSRPDLSVFKGQWSDWSSEVYWKTLGEPAVDDKIGLGMVLIPICVTVPLLLLLCYAPVKRWKQRAFIPTPAPYFQTLYSDCQGDFKSWVITQENTADMLKAEQTLQIDVLTKLQDVHEEVEKESQPEFHHQLMEGSTYSNIIDPGCDTSLLGIPYAVSTMSPLAQGSSLKSLTLSSLAGSPAEGDSGCWLCSHTSLERDPPFYCNEYCTLSTFQQISPIPAALQLQESPSTKPCPTELIGVEDALAEA